MLDLFCRLFCCASVVVVWGFCFVLLKSFFCLFSFFVCVFGYLICYIFRILVKNWKFFTAFSLNQSASLVFYCLLSIWPFTFVIPTVNSLTFVVTALLDVQDTGEPVGSRKIFGLSL